MNFFGPQNKVNHPRRAKHLFSHRAFQFGMSIAGLIALPHIISLVKNTEATNDFLLNENTQGLFTKNGIVGKVVNGVWSWTLRSVVSILPGYTNQYRVIDMSNV